MLSPHQMIVACFSGSASKADIESYVKQVVESGNDFDSSIYEAYSRDIDASRKKLELYLRKYHPEFSFGSREGEMACRLELKRQIDLLLQNKCSQEDFCDFFNRFESYLVCEDATDLKFCGDLYKACDCFDRDWNFLPSEYLVEEAQRVRESIQNEDTSKPPKSD